MHRYTTRGPGAVLVIGGANLDHLARSSEPVQLHTSNPGSASATPGGVARNVAENLARLGTATRLVLAVGDDAAGTRVLEVTQAAGVETIEVPWSGATGSYTAVLDHEGGLLAGVADMAATESITLDHLQHRWIEECTWLVLDGNLSTPTLAHALRVADAAGIPVVLDPVSAPKAAHVGPLLDDVRVHTVTPTEEELVALTGQDDLAAAAAQLHEQGVEVVWLRRGERGSVLFQRELDPVRVAVVVTRVEDVTGAGDAMLAAYVDALARGSTVVEAARYGAAAAALTVASPLTVRPDLTRAMIAAAVRTEDEEEPS